MISISKISTHCTLDAEQRLQTLNTDSNDKTAKQQTDKAAMYANLKKRFTRRLIDSCRKSSAVTIDELLFIALPDRLIARIGGLANLTKKSKKEQFPNLEKNEFEQYKALMEGFQGSSDVGDFVNLSNEDANKNCSQTTLICHGLSPIGDSILLLAELGRLYRTSIALNSRTKVMLADISWMSSNRSIRQFKTLNDNEIDSGLRLCLDMRSRLYRSLQIQVDLKEVTRYQRKDAISREKLEKIADHYASLSSAIWGDSVMNGPLQREQIQAIVQSLDNYGNMKTPDQSKPAHISSLARFPGALRALESGLEPHLSILRTIARQFSTFDEDIFKYFFAQYYAQDNYRGNVIKIAPSTERYFDEPFDKQDRCFRAWGDGSQASDPTEDHRTKNPTMAAVYLDQYSLGGMNILPYTPLSLDALRKCNYDHKQVMESLLMIEDYKLAKNKAHSTLKKTPIHQRNRLTADILSFIMFSREHIGPDGIDDAKQSVNLNKSSIFKSFNPLINNSIEHEFTAHSHDSIRSLWRTWIEDCDTPQPDYIPSHIGICLMLESDWTDEVYEAASALCAIACAIVLHVSA